MLIKIPLLILLIIISYHDIKEMIIPDVCVILMMPAAFFSSQPWNRRLLTACLLWFIYLVVCALSAMLKAEVPLGMGDIKLFTAVCLVSGSLALCRVFILSALMGGIFAFFLLSAKKAEKKDRFAYGPFIAISYAAVLLFA